MKHEATAVQVLFWGNCNVLCLLRQHTLTEGEAPLVSRAALQPSR